MKKEQYAVWFVRSTLLSGWQWLYSSLNLFIIVVEKISYMTITSNDMWMW